MKKVVFLSFLMLIIFFNCKERNIALEDMKLAKAPTIVDTEDQRIVLGNTNLSLISDFKFDYDEVYSKMTEEEERLFKSKEAYFFKSKYCEIALSHTWLIDTSKFTIRKAINTSIESIQATTNTRASERTDINMSEQFGCPSTLSKVDLISNNPNSNSYTYRVAVIFNGESAYYIIGFFLSTYKDGINSFDEMFKTIQIKS